MARRAQSAPAARLRRAQVVGQDHGQRRALRGAAPRAASRSSRSRRGRTTSTRCGSTAASGRRCRNLDPYLSDDGRDPRARSGATPRTPTSRSSRATRGSTTASRSTAATATRRWRRLLGLPVVLVIDARGMTRGIAPLILGYQAFDRDLRIAGVILNNLGGSRHEAKLRAVIEHYTDVPVLGAVHHDPRLAIVERHLGLMPSNEADDAPRADRRDRRRSIGRQVDLDRLLRVAADAPPLAGAGDAVARPRRRRPRNPTCASASRRTARSASTTPTTSTRCAPPARRSSRFDTLADTQPARCRRAVHRRRLSGALRARARGQRRAARDDPRARSRPACPSTPNAAGSCTSRARSPQRGRRTGWSARSPATS